MTFHRHTTALEVTSQLDLCGRTVLVTGGCAGIGLATAQALAAAGATVYAADVRIPDTDDSAVQALPLDLGSFADVRRFAGEFQARVPKLDILVNNAGIMAPPLSYTVDGHERQFGVNFLGHYLLTRSMEPALRAAGKARVVCISSIGHRRCDIQYDDIDFRTRPYDRWQAYSQSKTACALLAVAIDSLWRDRGIRSNTMNPGGSATGLHQYLDEAEQRRLGFLDEQDKLPDRWRPPEQCAATSVWLAAAPELADVGGKYFEDFAESGPWREEDPMKGVRPYAIDKDNALRLWKVAAEMTGLPLDALGVQFRTS
jgi:NAD(P)-dependent dehydrogenase (short-subunit alcohol dehydrogenase family)